jgi:hypothetical protein
MPFIIWGKKRVEKPLGHVADFCPICRELRAFEVFRAGMAGHIYGVTAGEGELLGYVKLCTKCGLKLGADPLQYACYDESFTTNLEVLIAKTFPGVREKFSDRLAFEEQVRKNPGVMSSQARQGYLMEPFVLFNGVVEQCFGGDVPLDAPSSLGCLGTIVATGVLFFLGIIGKGDAAKDRFLLAMLVVFGIGTALTLLQFYLRPHRYVRRKVFPFVVQALKPLEPTRSELANCLEKCVRMRMKIGTTFKLEQIWTELQGSQAFPEAGHGKKGILSPGIIGIIISLLLGIYFCFHYTSCFHSKTVPAEAEMQPSAPPPAKVPPAVKVKAIPQVVQSPNAVGVFIPAPDRKDMVHDPKRNILYISAGGSVLRYEMASQSFLSPLVLGGDLRGIDISPDNNLLAVADASDHNGNIGIHLVDLITGTNSLATFPAELLEGGTFSVVFGADGVVWITSTVHGSGDVPLRKYLPVSKHTMVIARVDQDTMLAASPDREFIAYAEANSSLGYYGRFRCRATQLQPPLRANIPLYEIGINRDGSQLALPTYGELILSGSAVQILPEREILGVAYHPQRDFIFLARAGISTIAVLETAGYTKVKELDFGGKFEWNGNHAFESGRLHLSSDGKFIFCTVPGGIRYAETGL